MFNVKKKIAVLLCVSMMIGSMQEGIFAENLFDNNQQENVEVVNDTEEKSSFSDADNFFEVTEEGENFEEEPVEEEEELVEEEPEEDDEATPSDIDENDDIDITEDEIASESEAESEEPLEEEEAVSTESEPMIRSAKPRMLFGASVANQYTTDNFLDPTSLGSITGGVSSITELTIQNGGGASGTRLTTLGSNDTGLYQDGTKLIIYLDGSDILYLGSTYKFSQVTDVQTITGLANITASASVTDYSRLFQNLSKLTSVDTENLDTQYATLMYQMFEGCIELKSLDLSRFDTSNVTDVESMLGSCRELERVDIHNFDITNITNFAQMLRNCQKLKSMRVSQSFADFYNVTENYVKLVIMSTGGTFPSPFLIVCDDSKNNKIYVGFDINAYFINTEGKDARGIVKNSDLTNPSAVDDKWLDSSQAISDFSIAPNKAIIKFGGWYTDKKYTNKWNFGDAITEDTMLYARWLVNGKIEYHLSAGETWKITDPSVTSDIVYGQLHTLPDANSASYENYRLIGWKISYSSGTNKNVYPSASMNATADVDIYPIWGMNIKTDLLDKLSNKSSITKISIVKGSTPPSGTCVREISSTRKTGIYLNGTEATIYITSSDTDHIFMETGTFNGFSSVESIEGLQYINTSNLTDFSNMFNGCANLISVDVSSFDTSKATNMEGMFRGCTNLLELDLTTLDMSNVKHANYMFQGDSSLTQVLVSSSFNEPTYHADWFDGCGISNVVKESGNNYNIVFCKDVYNGIDFTEVEINETLVSPVKVVANNSVVKPNITSTRDNFDCVGWYRDKSYAEYSKWDFDNYVATESMTLYAKWEVSVDFELDGGTWINEPQYKYTYTGGNTLMITLPVESDVDAPDTDYEWSGWYKGDTIGSGDKITGTNVDILETSKVHLDWKKYSLIEFYDGNTDNDIIIYDGDTSSYVKIVSTTNEPKNQKLLSTKRCYCDRDYVYDYYLDAKLKTTDYPSVTRSGYTLVGWCERAYTLADGDGWYYCSGSDDDISNDTWKVYAVWKKNTTTTTTTTTKTTTTYKGGNSGGSGGGGSAVTSKAAIQNQTPTGQQPTPTRQVQVSNTSNTAPVVQSANAMWSLDPATNTFKLEIKDAQGNPVQVQSGFCKVAKVEQQVIDNQVVNVPVESLYCFDEKGNLCTGWIQTADNAWHYFDTNEATFGAGAVNTWKEVDGKFYYFDGDGNMLSNATTPDGHVVNANGELVS